MKEINRIIFRESKGWGKVVVPLLQEFRTDEGIYEGIESQDEKSLKELFKELGIRSPLSYLTKTSSTEFVELEMNSLIEKGEAFWSLCREVYGLFVGKKLTQGQD